MRVNNKIIDLEALSNGSVKDFELLFNAYYPKVKSFLYSMLADDEEAKDLAQDVFVRIWSSRKQLQMVYNLNAYIYQTVKHVLYGSIAKKNNHHDVDIKEVFDLPSDDEIESIICCKELEDVIDKVIDNLPPQRKQVFCMSRKQGLSNDEISHRLGISKRTVETHISMALATLRKVISVFVILFNC